MYIYLYTDMWNEYLHIVINPVPLAFFNHTSPDQKHKT